MQLIMLDKCFYCRQWALSKFKYKKDRGNNCFEEASVCLPKIKGGKKAESLKGLKGFLLGVHTNSFVGLHFSFLLSKRK
jgi:hypothetical protein